MILLGPIPARWGIPRGSRPGEAKFGWCIEGMIGHDGVGMALKAYRSKPI